MGGFLKLLPLFILDNRGFMTANGQPDQSRSSRYVLKDYVAGRLLFCHAPDDAVQEEFHVFPARVRKELQEEKLPARQQRAMRVCILAISSYSSLIAISYSFRNILSYIYFQINKTQTSGELDKGFFIDKQRVAYIKGKTNLPHIRGLASEGSSTSSAGAGAGAGAASVHGSVQSLNGSVDKPWRQNKKEKKEKLRKRFSHLDQH